MRCYVTARRRGKACLGGGARCTIWFGSLLPSGPPEAQAFFLLCCSTAVLHGMHRAHTVVPGWHGRMVCPSAWFVWVSGSAAGVGEHLQESGRHGPRYLRSLRGWIRRQRIRQIISDSSEIRKFSCWCVGICLMCLILELPACLTTTPILFFFSAALPGPETCLPPP